MTNVWFSLLLTASVVASVLVLRHQMLDRKRTRRALVVGADLITKTFVEVVRAPDKPFIAGLGWFAVSVAAASAIPTVAGTIGYVANPVQIMIAANYSILLPCLIASYVYLIRSVGYFEALDVSRRQPRSRTRREDYPWLTRGEWICQALLLTVALCVQYQSATSEIVQPSPCSPWVDPSKYTELVNCIKEGYQDVRDGSSRDLSLAGALYYSLRGIDAFMALGLVAVTGFLIVRRKALFGRAKLISYTFPNLGPTVAIKNVGASLLLCIFFGSLATASNGIALWLQARHLGKADERLRLFTESTWVFWALATIGASIVASVLVLWLQARIGSQVQDLQNRVLARYSLPVAHTRQEAVSLSEAKMQADVIGRDLSVRIAIGEAFRKAETWPLPAFAAPAVIIALGSQTLNIGAALYSTLVGK